MPPIAEKREIQFITLYIISMIFLGISKETTLFIFPELGEQVYKTINFYFLSAIALMVTISWLSQAHTLPKIPKVPPLWAIAVNFLIFFPIAYIGLSWLFTGAFEIEIPALPQFVIETAISFNENLLAFILLPAVIPWGTGVGTIISGNIFTIRGYTLRFDLPNFNRFKYGLPSIFVISLLHLGAYSQGATSFSQLYTSLIIAFIMFSIMYLIKESLGFGASEAVHDAWNLTLISIRGSVI